MKERQRVAEPSREQIDRLIALYDRGELREALLDGEALARQFPGAPFILHMLGVVNAASGRLEQAVASYSKALRIEPESAATHFNLGSVLDRLGRTKEAVASYTAALKIKPEPKAYNNLGACLQDLGLTEAAAASYGRALELAPEFAEAHNNLGHALDRLHRPQDAVVSCRNALDIRPDYAEAHNNLGNALMHLGKSEEAMASYAAALRIKPDYAEAHRNLSDMKEYRPDDPQIPQMLELSERADLPDADRMLLSFALGKAYGDIGSHEKAFARIADGNRLRAEQLEYEIAPAREAFAKVMATFSEDLPSLGVLEEPEGAQERRVVFILGMPRSGTTLVEQILASHSRVHGGGELRLLDRAVQAADWGPASLSLEQLRSVRKSYRAGLAAIGGSEPYVTDKMPFNFFWIGFIFAAMPQAKVVHVKRDARATCWSNFKHFFLDRRMGFTNDLRRMAEYYRMYADLMALWHRRFPARIYDLSYEALTEDQEGETRKLLDYVGLDWEAQCLEFHETQRAVDTASSAQVRRKIFRGSSDEWRKYGRHIEPLIELLEGY